VRYTTPVSPFEVAFDVGDTIEYARSAALAQDLFAAVWSSRPVLLFVEAADEFFTLCGGMIGAVMRRRESMIRTGGFGLGGPIAPEVVSLERLKQLVCGVAGSAEGFPTPGAVYLLRDDAEQGEDDEIAAQVRELFVPQTYRVRARCTSTAGSAAAGSRIIDDERFPAVLSWLALYAGVPNLAQTIETDRLMDLSSLFAEASQLRESLIDRATLETTDPDFRAGFETTEHMVLKNLVAKHLRIRFPGCEVHLERGVSSTSSNSKDTDDDEAEHDEEDRVVRGRPDVRCPGHVSVEVETLRSLVRRGSNPFFALEEKLRRKLDVYRGDRQLWLVVPGDVALIAGAQLQALIRNLSVGREKPEIFLVVMELNSARVVFMEAQEPLRVEVRLVGASWRDHPEDGGLAKLTWNDVAGYTDLKQRLQEDVLAPLRDPSALRKAQTRIFERLATLWTAGLRQESHWPCTRRRGRPAMQTHSAQRSNKRLSGREYHENTRTV
jgi:hypothetical protein